jgi:hypothetical protein
MGKDVNRYLFYDAYNVAMNIALQKLLGCLNFILLVIVSHPNAIYAQPYSREGFFEKNFAANPLDTSSSRTKKSPSPHAKSKSEATDTPDTKRPIRELFSSEQEELAVEETHVSIKAIEGTPRRIKGVGAVINCHDRQHCKTQLEYLLNLQGTYSFLLSTIYLIGDIAVDYIPLTHSTEPEVLIKNIEVMQAVKFRREPPPHLSISKSPSWLIETEKDLFVLEGVSRLERYFTAKGEFIDPRNR